MLYCAIPTVPELPKTQGGLVLAWHNATARTWVAKQWRLHWHGHGHALLCASLPLTISLCFAPLSILMIRLLTLKTE